MSRCDGKVPLGLKLIAWACNALLVLSLALLVFGAAGSIVCAAIWPWYEWAPRWTVHCLVALIGGFCLFVATLVFVAACI